MKKNIRVSDPSPEMQEKIRRAPVPFPWIMVTWDKCIREARSRKLSTSIKASSTVWPRRSRLEATSGVERFFVTVRVGFFFFICRLLIRRRLDKGTRVLIMPACTSTMPSFGSSSTVASLSLIHI